MKKTLVALMALAGVAMAADAITLGSYYTVDGVNYDAVANFYGQTKNQIVSMSGVTCDKLAFDASSISNLSAVALNTGDMLASDSTLTTGTTLELNSLSMLAREDDAYQGAGSTLSIILDNVTFTSAEAVYSDGGSGHALVTYTFAGVLPTFELGDTLTFAFTLADGTIENVNKIPAAALKGLSAAPTVFNGGWQAAIQLDVNTPAPAVPEPTTATLSLLALAGLAARRRRK